MAILRRGGATSSVLALVLAGAPSGARGADAAASRYPFAASIQVDGAGPSSRYAHEPNAGFLTNPAVTVDLAGQARAAYAARAADMFRGPASGEPALLLEIRVTGAEVVGAPGRGLAVVRHDVVARTPEGVEIARWSPGGEGDVVGFEAESVTAAFARAARSAARELEQRFDASPEIARWRTSSGFGPRVAVAPAGAAPTAEPDPARPPWIAYVDGAIAAVRGVEGAAGVSSGVDVGLRAGATHRFVFLQLAVDRWGTVESEAPGQILAPGTLSTNLTAWLVGLEAGALHPLGGGLEVRGGLGAYWLDARAVKPHLAGAYYEIEEIVVDRGWVIGSVGGGLHYVTPPQGWNFRGRVGVDVRRLLGSTRSFDALGDITVARWLASLVVGVEFPGARKR